MTEFDNTTDGKITVERGGYSLRLERRDPYGFIYLMDGDKEVTNSAYTNVGAATLAAEQFIEKKREALKELEGWYEDNVKPVKKVKKAA